MSQNDWKTWSRYNALNISKKILILIDGLAEAKLIDVARGSYSGPYGLGNRTTRIRASDRLKAMFPTPLVRPDNPRLFQRRYVDEGIGNKGVIGNQFSPHIVGLRGILILDLLSSATFPRLENNTLLPFNLPDIVAFHLSGADHRVQIDQHHQFVRRIFSRGDWSCNGRFYGPWWQQISKELRAQIFINDTPTVEVDLKGLHVAILSAEKGEVVEGDPYELPDRLVLGAPAELQRMIIKKLVLTALNAKDKKAAFSSFREGFPAGHMAKGMTNEELEALLGAFTAKHPHLSDCLCTDQGIRLMNIDGKIAAVVQNYMTLKRIPVLSVHDSFIVDYTHVKLLRRAMQFASKLVVGRELAVEANALGLDEANFPPDVLQHFKSWRIRPVSPL